MSGSKKRRRKRSWRYIEAEFRVWSFHVYYHRTFKNEHDHELRFAKALLASCKPIRDRKPVIEWWRTRENGNADIDFEEFD